MRTTVEMKPEHRRALLALAAQRGEKGLSNVLAEAIGEYLHGNAERKRRIKNLLALGGSLSNEEADELRRVAKELRGSWR